MSEPITGPWNVDDQTYFSDCDHVSQSMLKVFATSVPGYYQRFVAKTMAAPKPSAEMHLGTLLHAALLEPERWNDRVRKITVDGRTKQGKEYNRHMHDLADLDPTRLFVASDEEDAVNAMYAAVMGHEEAARAMTLPGTHEGPIRWKDEASGLWAKCKIDRLCSNGLICDLKTTADIAGFPWSCHKYSYERQAAHYLAGAWSAIGQDGPFLLIAVQSSAPYEVRTMVFGDEELASGRRQNARLLAELAECHRTGNWASRYKGVEVIRYKQWQIED